MNSGDFEHNSNEPTAEDRRRTGDTARSEQQRRLQERARKIAEADKSATRRK